VRLESDAALRELLGQMGKPFEFVTSISAGEFPKLVKCSWPRGKVSLYEDRMILDARAERYELQYSEIDCCSFNLLQVNIEHHNPSVPKDISINGILVSRAIKKAIREHHLPIRVK
jgi:hypothetical protein